MEETSVGSGKQAPNLFCRQHLLVAHGNAGTAVLAIASDFALCHPQPFRERHGIDLAVVTANGQLEDSPGGGQHFVDGLSGEPRSMDRVSQLIPQFFDQRHVDTIETAISQVDLIHAQLNLSIGRFRPWTDVSDMRAPGRDGCGAVLHFSRYPFLCDCSESWD
ncbi:MAG: hypothetical protein ABSD31_13630 [Candidatus Binataceae bacterium]